MNKITEPEELSYKEARAKLGKVASIILGLNGALALIMWLSRGVLFQEPQADYLGGLIAGGLVITGLISFFALKAMASRVVRSKPLNNEDQKDL